MRRSEQLSPLSREHHVALEVALRLRKASDADAETARDRFLRFFDSEGREHFRAEEEILLPAFARHAAPDDPDVARVLTEHEELRRYAAELSAAPVGLDTLHAVGRLLHDHVRHEERTLFPRIEAALDDDELAAVGAELAAGGSGHCPPRR